LDRQIEMANELRCWCQQCGRELEPSHTGKCPYCGKTGKNCEVTASVAIGLKVSASATKTRSYFEWFNRDVRTIVGFTIIGSVSTIAGYFAGKAFGALIGLGVSLAINVTLTILSKRKKKILVREVTKYQ